MDHFVANQSPWRAFAALAGSILFVAAGLWFLGLFGLPPSGPRASPEKLQLIGWACVLFFGTGAVIFARRMFDAGEELRIDGNGILYHRWSDRLIPWSQIADVSLWQYKRQKAIQLKLRNPELHPGKGLLGRLQAMNRGLTGGDVSISMTITDRSTDEALAAIDHFRSASDS